MGAALLAITAVLAVPACGVGSKSSPESAVTTTEAGDAGKPVEAIDIDAAIDASKDEGKVIVYGNPSAEQWEPVLEAFHEAYPWIEVETFDLGGAEAFQRYLTEEATGSGTADVIVNTDGAGWLDLIDRGKVVDYVDPELADLPDFAVAAPGVFAMSVDPLIGIFNTKALPENEQPDTLEDLAGMAEELDGKIGTIEVENGQAGLGTWGYPEEHGEEGWDVLDQLGPHTEVEDGSGALLGKLQTGEYAAAFMASGSIRALIDGTETGDILNYTYLTDATPLPTRGMAVTTAAESPNAAKVLINFLLSQEGQTAGCAGGFTPYRDDVECDNDLAAITDIVGEGNALVVGYPEELEDRAARDADALERGVRPMTVATALAGGRLKHSWLPAWVTQYLLWAGGLILIVGPIIPVVWASLWSTPLYEAGGSLTLGNYQDLLTDPKWWEAVRNSVIFAVLTTVGSVVLGTAMAVLFTRTDLPGQRLLPQRPAGAGRDPRPAAAARLDGDVLPAGYVTRWIEEHTFVPVFWDLYSVPGMSLVAIGIAAPVVYLFARGALASQDSSLEMAARSAGASPLRDPADRHRPAAAAGAPQLVDDRVRSLARGAWPPAHPRHVEQHPVRLDLPLRQLAQRGAVAAGPGLRGGRRAARSGDRAAAAPQPADR